MHQIAYTNANGDRKVFNSVSEAARAFDTTTRTIYNWINHPEKATRLEKGAKFCYLEEAEAVVFQEDKNGKPIANEVNIERWLNANYDSFAFNELTSSIEINGTSLDDKMIDDICVRMGKTVGINNDKKTRQVITYLGLQNSYNPLKEEIESYQWDGKPRAETFFIDFLGAHDTPLNRFYTRCWLKAAIKRLYEPGCMWDNMIILYDKTGGTGKTKILQRLSLGYYAQDPEVGSKDAIGVMNKAWIINFDELARFDKKGMNSLKTFITATSDVDRLAYARYTENFNRHIVFAGTTNEEYFLRDYTSDRERRFWVVNCSGERKDDNWWREHLPNSYIRQVWAEVYSWYKEDPDIDNRMSIELQDDEQFVQTGHKSLGKDPEFQVQLEEGLNSKYSADALTKYSLFKREIFSADGPYDRIHPLNKVQLKWLAGAFKKQEDYTASAVMSLGGWVIRDGWVIRRGPQEEIEFNS